MKLKKSTFKSNDWVKGQESLQNVRKTLGAKYLTENHSLNSQLTEKNINEPINK